MSWRRANSPGWAAFDLKQQQKKGLELEAANEPYPLISNTNALLHPGQNLVKNNDVSVRPFSSVLLPSGNFPTLTVHKNVEKPLQVGNSSANQSNNLVGEINKGNNVIEAYEKLKELHSWADKSLIEDVLAAVSNNMSKASTLLKTMVSSDTNEKNKEADIGDLKFNSEDFYLDANAMPSNKGVSVGEITDLAELSCSLEDGLPFKNKEMIEDHESGGKMLPDHCTHMKLVWGNLRFIPVEPEWEEDDIYLIHRKDAMRMMRSASRLSKAANDAYLRGDHLSAQQFSQKAREEWKASEKLNAKAAEEILSIRNGNNDVWKLDLHGLHAAEAVQALQEHLQKIESQVPPVARSSSPDRINPKAGTVGSASLKSLSYTDMEKLDKQQASCRQRTTSLDVITGRGTHSRGQAALPKAIESFLSEKGYHYDEARPGVITVRPKYRHH